MNILSASPYRATIKVEESFVDNDQENIEEDFERDGTLTADYVSPMVNFKKIRPSPIRDDSIELREQKDELLNSFNVNIS